MTLHFDLRVNGNLIGTFEATNTMLSTDPKSQWWYQCVTREYFQNEFEVGTTGSTLQVFHDPADGPWELVRKTLAQLQPPTTQGDHT